MLKYRIIRREVVCDGLDKNDADYALSQMHSEKNEVIESEEYKDTRDDMNRKVKGLGRDPDLYKQTYK